VASLLDVKYLLSLWLSKAYQSLGLLTGPTGLLRVLDGQYLWNWFSDDE